MARSAWSITFSVWRALFLRDALFRLFSRRGAWFWVLFEPITHIAFFVVMFTVIRVRDVGGIDTSLWLMAGFLGFFMFRRTMTIGMSAISMARALFTYRQVKPVDSVLIRSASEGALMFIVSVIVFLGGAAFGLDIIPDNGFGVLYAFLTLWLLGLGVALVASVPKVLVAEVGDLIGIMMMPLYIISGIIFPIAQIPQPYRDWLLLNPIVHLIDYLRFSFASHYIPIAELDVVYPLVFSLTLIFLGLMLQQIYRKKVIHK